MVSDYDEEMDFDGKAHLENQKGENRPADNAQNISQNSISISLNSSQELKTTLSKHVHAGTVSNQLSATRVLGEPQQLLNLNCNGSPVKAQDQNTQMSSGSNCEQASINPAGLTEYVEVNEDQKPQSGRTTVWSVTLSVITSSYYKTASLCRDTKRSNVTQLLKLRK